MIWSMAGSPATIALQIADCLSERQMGAIMAEKAFGSLKKPTYKREVHPSDGKTYILLLTC